LEEDAVLAFVRDTIRSVWSLELLLLLQRDVARSWQIPELVAALHANTQVVTESLAALGSAGLVRMSEQGLYHYGPTTSRLADNVAELVALYGRKPVTVVRAILSAPNTKIRTFADAFRFRGRT
jgi:DNA-binding IclR family transcriptional regulator